MSTRQFFGALYLEGSLEDPDSLVSRTFAQPQEIVEERHNQFSTGFEGETEDEDKSQCLIESKWDSSRFRCIIGSIATLLYVLFFLIFIIMYLFLQ